MIERDADLAGAVEAGGGCGGQRIEGEARFVLLDAAPTLVDMSQDEIGLAYTWRCGPADRDIGHASYVETTHVFQGVGLSW